MATNLPTNEVEPKKEVESKQNIEKSRPGLDNFIRFGKYFATRLVMMVITLTIAIYLTVLIANMGGAVDKIREAQIKEKVGLMLMGNTELRYLSPEERRAYEDELIELERTRIGLDRPFIVRSFEYLGNAMTLNLGRSEYLNSDKGSRLVKNIILERLPTTLLLIMTGFLILFFGALFFGLYLSRNYGSVLDKIVTTLAPMSCFPAWFWGILLIMLFAAVLGWFPFGGMVKAPPPESKILYALSVLHHLFLPVLSMVIGSFFISTFSQRTFFLIYSTEDYVEMAKAKGLSARAVERRYVLRPTLPPIVTQFALGAIGMWMGAAILETVFNWPGLGRLFLQAINLYDTPVIVASAVIYGYLLGVTVLLLDLIYALIDPRVKVGAGGGN